MDYAAMKAKVRLLLGETDNTNTYYTDAEIDTQINDSILLVAGEVPTNLTYSEIVTIASQGEYGLPTDFLQLKDLQIYVTTTTRRVQMEKLNYDEFEYKVGGNFSMEGEPNCYRIEFGATETSAGSRPGDIWIYPIPPDTSYTLRLVYYQKPDSLSSGIEVSELPEFLHMPVCYHAAMHMAMKDDSSSKANQMAGLYNKAIDSAKKVVNKRDRSGAFQIRTSYGRSSLLGNLGKRIRRGPLR
jgi:hypothetical protein